MAKKLTKPIALFFTVFAVLVAALLHFGALDITTSAAWDGTSTAGFGGGDGSSAETACEIANGEQLAFLAQQVNSGTDYEGKFFKLTADIDLGGKEWTPIGGYYHCFKGTFDGDGHTVSNFIINLEDECIGLFGKNNGTIMNLGVENAEITGYDYVGGVCGENNGTIKNCYNTGAVSGNFDIGGVCGFNSDGGTIQNCYNTGAVSGNSETSSAIGGVCGYNNTGTITNCYYNTDFCTVGGIEGSDVEGSAAGLTSEELCNIFGNDEIWQSGVYSGDDSRIDCKLPSLIGVGEEQTIHLYNFGTSDSHEWRPFTEITTAEQFKAIGNDETSLGKNYVLGADIDFGGEEITPIGDSAKPFTGKFSGDGHTVSNFIINLEDECIGLFGKNNGTIMNLGVENAEITGYDYVGGVCGENNGTIKNCYNTGAVSGNFDIGGVCGFNSDGGTIQNCYNIGAVSGNGETSSVIGGVCGCNSDGGTIQNCYNTGAVKGEFTIGGVCGYNNTGCTINNCYNTGTVNGNGEDIGGVCGLNGTSTITNSYNIGNVSGTGYVGGVCGYSYGGTITNNYNIGNVSGTDYVGGVCGYNNTGCTINNCYNTGTVNGNGEDIGGVCGLNGTSTITNSYNIGNVSGTGYVGGVCGYSYGGTITNNYNIGNVSGTDYVGGVCGRNNGGTIQNCYYNKDIFASGGIGGGEGSATGLTTLQMTDVNALETMKFDSEWSKKANDKDGIAYYPSLKESDYQPFVEFTKKLELEPVGDKTPVYGDKIEFRTKALITFINAFGGEDITVEDTAGVFVVNLNGKSYSVTDNKFEYTANTAGKVTFTLVYKDSSSDYFPKEYSEDVVVTVNKAVVTIKAKNYTVKTGSALPTFEYMVTGLVNGDTLAFVPNITCAAKDTSTVGTYDIIVAVSITEDERYTYTTQNGTLTIERNSTPVGPVGPVGPNIPANPTTPANSDVQLNPNEPQIKGENGKSGWNAIAQEVKAADDGDIITVDMNGTTELPKKILEAIKGKDIDIVLDMGNGFVWTINGNDVKNTQSVDMGVSKGAKIPVRVLNKVTGENSYIAISLKHNGSFGFKAVLTVELSKKNKGLYANLYYYNSKTKKTEFISSDKIGSDGKADLGFTHASDYVIVLDKANHGKPVVTATATKNSIKLKWNAVSGATKYRVYKIVNGKAKLVIETTKHGLNINKVKSDTEYQYIVRAYVDGSWTSMKKSDIVTVKTKQ